MMNKYRCTDCGAVFNRDDAETRHENVGEFWGSPAYMDVVICPECRSDELEDFEYPHDDCASFEGCDYDCENCPLLEEQEDEE